MTALTAPHNTYRGETDLSTGAFLEEAVANGGVPNWPPLLDGNGGIYVSREKLRFIIDEGRAQLTQVSNQTNSIVQRIGIIFAFSSILLLEALRHAQPNILSWVPTILLLSSALVGLLAILRDFEIDFPLGTRLRNAIVMTSDDGFDIEESVGNNILDLLDTGRVRSRMLWKFFLTEVILLLLGVVSFIICKVI
ncbi:MAG: hypothetical protein GX224_03900 [Thermoplasmatales archaeon]|nr:hypothetical protein [Thermoplasmatales archaeon]